METISNVASAASKAIFGEQNPQATTQGNETGGQEPISGQQGKGTVNEPFDQGNSENPTSTTPATSTDNNTSSGLTGTSTTDNTSSGSINPTEMSTSHTPNNPTNVAAGGEPNPHTNTDKTGVVAGREGDARKGEDIVPSERQSNPGADPASGTGPEFKQQGADKPGDAPSGPQEDAVKEQKDEGEEALKKRDPNDHSGEPMKMHDSSAVPGTQEERRESKAGMPGGQEHGKDSKGTGEEWIKTSGLAADGGDFDAIKAGAGREANRLLEEKGVQKTEPGQPAPEPAAGDSKGDKPGMGQKIKEKLHLGHTK